LVPAPLEAQHTAELPDSARWPEPPPPPTHSDSLSSLDAVFLAAAQSTASEPPDSARWPESPPPPTHSDSLSSLDEVFSAAAQSVASWPAAAAAGAEPTTMEHHICAETYAAVRDPAPVLDPATAAILAPAQSPRVEPAQRAWYRLAGTEAATIPSEAGSQRTASGVESSDPSSVTSEWSTRQTSGGDAAGDSVPSAPQQRSGFGVADLFGGVAQTAAARVATRVGGLRGLFGSGEGAAQAPLAKPAGQEQQAVRGEAAPVAYAAEAPPPPPVEEVQLGEGAAAAGSEAATPEEEQQWFGEEASLAAADAAADVQAMERRTWAFPEAPAETAVVSASVTERFAGLRTEEVRPGTGAPTEEAEGARIEVGPEAGAATAEGERDAARAEAEVVRLRAALHASEQALQASELRAGLLQQQKARLLQRLSHQPPTPTTPPTAQALTPAFLPAVSSLAVSSRATEPRATMQSRATGPEEPAGAPPDTGGEGASDTGGELQIRLAAVCALVEAHVEVWAAERAALRARCEAAESGARRALALLQATRGVASAIAAECLARERGQPSSPGTLAIKAFGGSATYGFAGGLSDASSSGWGGALAGSTTANGAACACGVATPSVSRCSSTEMPSWLRGAEAALHDEGGGAASSPRHFTTPCAARTPCFTGAGGSRGSGDDPVRRQLIEAGRARFTQLRSQRKDSSGGAATPAPLPLHVSG